MTSPEPRFAGIATTIGDPTRARMLAALMGGQFLCAGELAAAAGVSPQTASSHIARLIASELVVLRTQGRHRYFRLADAEVAHALETLSLVAERSAGFAKWEQGAYKPLKVARTCYNHLAGELGVALFEGLLARDTLASAEGRLDLTAEGRAQLRAAGVDLAGAPPNGARRYAYPCLDWSERRDHLAGPLAAALLDHCFARHWLRRMPDSRAVLLTPAGRTGLAPWLDPSGTHQLASHSS
ncbi:MAG TPA: winged helix-turn-helix domain-containing protein [Caldimonas sp.]